MRSFIQLLFITALFALTTQLIDKIDTPVSKLKEITQKSQSLNKCSKIRFKKECR